VSASAVDTREVRHFELEADRRARRLFLFVVIGFAILAVAGGIFAAWLLLEDETTPELAPPKPKPPEPIEEFGAGPPVEFRDEEPVKPPPQRFTKLAESLGDGDIARGLGRLQAAFDACARKHGALEGTIVNLDFSVGGDGRVGESAARPPNGKTPLGLCVAGVVKTGSFAKSRNGRRDIRWSVKLHP
jgi:hypothetical protein